MDQSINGFATPFLVLNTTSWRWKSRVAGAWTNNIMSTTRHTTDVPETFAAKWSVLVAPCRTFFSSSLLEWTVRGPSSAAPPSSTSTSSG